MSLHNYKELIKYILGIVLLTLVNFIGGKGVFLFAYVENDISLLWPPTGLSLAFLLRFGARFWPGVFLGNFLVHFSNGQPLLLASTTGVGDLLGIIVSIYFLKKAGFSNKLTRQKDILNFIFFGLILCSIIGASIGATARLLDGMVSAERFATVWASWFIGDISALIILVPVLITFPSKSDFKNNGHLRLGECAGLLTGITLVSYFVFLNLSDTKGGQLPLVYMPMPFLIWAALRCGPFTTAFAGLITSGMAVIGTAQGFGPFIQDNVYATIGFLWSYIIVASILSLLLAAIQSESQKARSITQMSEARFKALSTASFEAIFITKEGIITDFNNAAIDLFGYYGDQIKGRKFDSLLDKNSSEVFQMNMISKPQFPFELRAVRNDGSVFFAEFRNRVYEFEGEPVVIIAVRDITQLKKAIEKEQELNEELALREEELRQQLLYTENMNTKLERANKALDRFVYSASHDLRAPISSALGLINVARMEKDGSRLIEYMNLQEVSLKKLDKFISDILDFSRNSRTEIVKEDIDFEEMIDDVFKNYEFIENADRLTKSLTVNQNGPFSTDKRRMNIVLNNLISNAIRYQNPDQESPFVKVEIETGRGEATIKIIDNGLGIAKEHQEKVFDMFYRANNKQVGSGLGLYIVMEVLEKLHASITLESEVNVGTTFTIVLPNLS